MVHNRNYKRKMMIICSQKTYNSYSLIGQEKCNIGYHVLLVSVLYSDKKQQRCPWRETIETY